ncbi:phosphotyrosine protein phosphatase [Lachnospiraceae bacterium ZAX-1]
MTQCKKIIFVDESGTIRSAMAEAIMKEHVLKHPLEIVCRGLVVLFPEPMNQKAEAVLISNGINVENQMSVQLTEDDFSSNNFIIAMTETQKTKILQNYEHAVNVHVLTQLVGDELEIMDPYGGTLRSYGICYETLNNSIKKLVDQLNGSES